MPYRIVPIVEGDGEVEAVPLLLRRIRDQINPPVAVDIAPPIRRQRGTLLNTEGIESAVRLAAIKMAGNGAILILIDSDDECPKDLAPKVVKRAKKARADKRISVVLAHREYEAWFLASASSLAGVRRLRADIVDHDGPETVRGCKEWMERWLPKGSKYSERPDQAALSAVFDMTLARRTRSFDKLWREVGSIFEHGVETEIA
jgi:hypothetical protein